MLAPEIVRTNSIKKRVVISRTARKNKGIEMRKLIKLGIIPAMGLGLLFVTADVANAQTYRREARREYRDDVRDAQREYNRRVRRGENPRKARREYREDVRDARREFRDDIRRGNSGWYRYRNGRRIGFYPFASWIYRNGQFYRRY